MERGKWDQVKCLIDDIILCVFLSFVLIMFETVVFGTGAAASGPLGWILVLTLRLWRILKNVNMKRGKWDQVKWLIGGIILCVFLGFILIVFVTGTAASGPLGAILGSTLRLRRILKNDC